MTSLVLVARTGREAGQGNMRVCSAIRSTFTVYDDKFETNELKHACSLVEVSSRLPSASGFGCSLMSNVCNMHKRMHIPSKTQSGFRTVKESGIVQVAEAVCPAEP